MLHWKRFGKPERMNALPSAITKSHVLCVGFAKNMAFFHSPAAFRRQLHPAKDASIDLSIHEAKLAASLPLGLFAVMTFFLLLTAEIPLHRGNHHKKDEEQAKQLICADD